MRAIRRRLDPIVVAACGLTFGFCVLGGLGILFNVTAAVVAGWLGCAAAVLVAYMRA